MPKEKNLQPPQHQRQQSGREHKMKPRPRAEDEKHRGSGKLQDKVAIITGGDSGIGRAVAIAFAKEAPIFQSFTSKNERMRMKPSDSLKNTGVDAC